MVEILSISGQAVRPYLTEIAKLRIEIFREYPYLYDGSDAYERDYLEVYAKSNRSVIVLAVENSQIVGASTGLPLTEADEAFQQPFINSGIDPATVFYFGESVLRKSHRSQGLGHRFFDHREAHAAAHGFSINAFCAVQRPHDHPLRPADHRDNDEFWRKRGYQKTPGLDTKLSWQQVDQPQEVSNQLIFWLKRTV
jgi:GNAT superfamily N-acetyltransferase